MFQPGPIWNIPNLLKQEYEHLSNLAINEYINESPRNEYSNFPNPHHFLPSYTMDHSNIISSNVFFLNQKSFIQRDFSDHILFSLLSPTRIFSQNCFFCIFVYQDIFGNTEFHKFLLYLFNKALKVLNIIKNLLTFIGSIWICMYPNVRK